MTKHKKPKLNSVGWHFHYKNHDELVHCEGGAANPFKITSKGSSHVISKEYARGHGIKRKPTWFKFNKNPGDGYLLESGTEIPVSKVPSSFKKGKK